MTAALLVTSASVAEAQEQKKPRPPRPETNEAVIVIDLRPGDAAARAPSLADFVRGLNTVQGIEVVTDTDLRAALTATGGDPLVERATAELAAAGELYGKLQCDDAAARADEASRSYAALQARGEEVGESLTQAYVYQLLCHHGAARAADARRAATALHALGHTDPPDGVTESVWTAYPAVDATTNVPVVELTVTTEPEGATVWLDHREIGVSPVTVPVSAGEHLIAAASGTSAAAVRVEVSADNASAAVGLDDAPGGRWGAVAARIDAWRSGEEQAASDALAALMRELGVRFALVLAGTDTVEVWSLSEGDELAQKSGRGTLSDPVGAAALVIRQKEVWSGDTADPDAALLREDPSEAKKEKKGPKWWVYASIIGAVAIGATVVLANDLADDRQRFEIRFP